MKKLIIVTLCLMLYGTGLATPFIWSTIQERRNPKTSITAASTNPTSPMEQVARHMVLPDNEEPVIATITDESKLSSPFLKAGQVGDTVLLYNEHQRVIIYRASSDRIIDVGPLQITPLQ